MSLEQLSAAIAAAIMLAASAALLALLVLRRLRNAIELIRRRLDELQQSLERAENRIAQLEAARRAGGDDPAGGGRPAAALKADEVSRLASQGLNAVEIARRMNMDVGEVELMINLHSRPPASS